jgi:hypothetical protein
MSCFRHCMYTNCTLRQPDFKKVIVLLICKELCHCNPLYTKINLLSTNTEVRNPKKLLI